MTYHVTIHHLSRYYEDNALLLAQWTCRRAPLRVFYGQDRKMIGGQLITIFP